MQETKRNVTKENDLQKIKELRLMDDDFFSEALDGKTEAVEYILNTVLERDDIKVKSTKAQVEYKSATKRSIKLDIQAEDVNGRLMDSVWEFHFIISKEKFLRWIMHCSVTEPISYT